MGQKSVNWAVAICAGVMAIGACSVFAAAKFLESFGKGKPTSQLISRQESLDVCNAYVGDLCQQLDKHFQKGELIDEDGMLGSSWHKINYKMTPDEQSAILGRFKNAGALEDDDGELILHKNDAGIEVDTTEPSGLQLSIYWD